MNRIGSGSGGTVYKVLHGPSGKLFALKVIYGNPEDDVRPQICGEIEILRYVDNLNIIKCHDIFDHAGEIQVLLEYMDGGSLEGTHVAYEPSLSYLTRQVLSGIYYLHHRKIVHRDIKPSNLLRNYKCSPLDVVELVEAGQLRTFSIWNAEVSKKMGRFQTTKILYLEMCHQVVMRYCCGFFGMWFEILFKLQQQQRFPSWNDISRGKHPRCIYAAADCVVTKVLVKEGQVVKKGHTLMWFKEKIKRKLHQH